MSLYIPLREYAHPNMDANGPFCDIAVWVATVVGKSPYATGLCGVDELGEA